MTSLSIQLTPDEEARLRSVARRAGLDPAECARRLLTQHLPAEPTALATRELLRAWRDEDATDDPAELRRAEEELAAFKQAMNVSRAKAGARPLYS